RTYRYKGCKIRSAGTWHAGEIGLDMLFDIFRYGFEPPAKVFISMEKALAGNIHYPTGTVVLVKQSLHLADYFRIVFHKSPGTVEALLFTAPQSNQNGSLRIGIDFLQYTYSFHHGNGTCGIIRSACAAIPGVKMRRQEDVFIRLFGTLDFRNGVESRHLAQFFG